VKRLALDRGLPVIQPVKLKEASVAGAIAAAAPDVLVVVAYGRILPRPLLDAAPHGAVNVHFSLLPELRGAAPVPWALARGHRETGVTTFRLDEGLDTGDLLLQERVPIEPREHAPALLERLAETGAALLLATLSGLDARTIRPRAQDEARATHAPILTREDGHWDPRWTAVELEGRVRGFDPWPGVWAGLRGTRIRLVDVRASEGVATAPPGAILDLRGEAVLMACADESVAAVECVQLEGRRAVTARAAISGRQLALGDRLGPARPAA
jgi:methionyl-tRNA formyltransferase